jgi:hypothetical protein
MNAFEAPMIVPADRHATIPRGIPITSRPINEDAIIVERVTVSPTERSIPAVIITRV